MATIDLIVLGMIKQEALSAYDIQKLVEYRNISKWVKISTPSIYKKVIQLEKKGYIQGEILKEGKVEKVIYHITKMGDEVFSTLMNEITNQPINFYLDFNAVIVNLLSTPKDQQNVYIENIRLKLMDLQNEIDNNLETKESDKQIPVVGMEVLKQQKLLTNAIMEWLYTLQNTLKDNKEIL
ncbi:MULTISPECIES: PadR family transcriptional regulator [unclassified Breznakia]|uniref:PadR family transcriptional regulator n=1 Tax=unclassified Breznakia TaxID=2623764 RepID=UPI002475570E|nr:MULTISPECIES: PadR family transcriptional regulator [unclassified Breznakia]MDH6366941.1 DNA-binding PadR family transcriptional regulator [Breznakia sp. PH1-1]MDH6404119.1 DNA-binding PadR family transcriptional regulator [Breznakia sp. PF1-11]MDH6411828.1 DNA-binding PadR family transcriptional regulator [Breznakia sp. PFB1-11]MDH6414107.1 DNA-binding PadR family transcriptional regulator [Breznakia sp. PFB1-14]MDH6416536.1 DNA-binding PadR family transcriptional regulator [Breznakia sp. 